MITLVAAAVSASMFTASLSQAAVINSTYTPLGGDSWLASFRVVNDGTPSTFAGFTVDFPNATNIALVSSPAAWDSVVFQPDVNIPDNGYFDSFLRNSGAMTAGQSIDGFRISFTYTPGATPGALPFSVNSETFAPLFFGTTTVTAVPEPGTAILAALGLGLFAFRKAQVLAHHRSTNEVNA